MIVIDTSLIKDEQLITDLISSLSKQLLNAGYNIRHSTNQSIITIKVENEIRR